MPDSVLVNIQAMYPDKVITEKDTWDNLAAVYGERALELAGIRYMNSVAREYLMMQKNGAPARELDKFLKAAIQAGKISQSEADEIRYYKG